MQVAFEHAGQRERLAASPLELVGARLAASELDLVGFAQQARRTGDEGGAEAPRGKLALDLARGALHRVEVEGAPEVAPQRRGERGVAGGRRRADQRGERGLE